MCSMGQSQQQLCTYNDKDHDAPPNIRGIAAVCGQRTPCAYETAVLGGIYGGIIGDLTATSTEETTHHQERCKASDSGEKT